MGIQLSKQNVLSFRAAFCTNLEYAVFSVNVSTTWPALKYTQSPYLRRVLEPTSNYLQKTLALISRHPASSLLTISSELHPDEV